MRIYHNASDLFVPVFNTVDAATGAPQMPATGAPTQPETKSGEGAAEMEDVERSVQEVQDNIGTLQQMGAGPDAMTQQGALESRIQEFKKSLDALTKACQSMILEYHKNGVPNLDSTQTPTQAGAGSSADPMGIGGAGDPMAGLGGAEDPMAAGAPPAGAAPMGAPPMGVPPMGDAAGMGGGLEAAPSGASVPGMQTYDDLTQQNQQGVTGRGGSTMPLQ